MGRLFFLYSYSKLLEEIVREAFKVESIDVKYSYFPWLRSFSLVRNEEFDGIFPWINIAQLGQEFYTHKIPPFKNQGVYFHFKKLFGEEGVISIKHHPSVIDESDYFIIFSRKTLKDKRLADTFDSGPAII